MSRCPDTNTGEHDWLATEMPARTHDTGRSTINYPPAKARICQWCEEIEYDQSRAG